MSHSAPDASLLSPTISPKQINTNWASIFFLLWEQAHVQSIPQKNLDGKNYFWNQRAAIFMLILALCWSLNQRDSTYSSLRHINSVSRECTVLQTKLSPTVWKWYYCCHIYFPDAPWDPMLRLKGRIPLVIIKRSPFKKFRSEFPLRTA